MDSTLTIRAFNQTDGADRSAISLRENIQIVTEDEPSCVSNAQRKNLFRSRRSKRRAHPAICGGVVDGAISDFSR